MMKQEEFLTQLNNPDPQMFDQARMAEIEAQADAIPGLVERLKQADPAAMKEFLELWPNVSIASVTSVHDASNQSAQ